VAVHSTVVSPKANGEPDAGVQVTGTVPSVLSVAVAMKVAVAPEASAADEEMAVGNDNIGPVPSVTVTVNDPVAVLFAASDALQLTVVAPTMNVEPDTGVQVTGTTPLMLSVPVTL